MLPYRGGDERCRNRCEQGELIVEDYIQRKERDEEDLYREPSGKEAYIGGLHETIGDFRLVGDLGGHDEAYDTAEEIYLQEGIEDKSLVYYDGRGIQWLMTFFNSVSQGADMEQSEIDWTDAESTYLDWLEYKRERLPEMIKKLAESGTWEYY